MQVFSFAELKLCQYVWRNTVRMPRKWPSSWKSILRYKSTVLFLYHSTHLSISDVFDLSGEVYIYIIKCGWSRISFVQFKDVSLFTLYDYMIWYYTLQVQKVMYPGLPSHPQHQIAKKQMKMFSGMIAAEIRGGVQGGKILVEVCVVSNHQNVTDYS